MNNPENGKEFLMRARVAGAVFSLFVLSVLVTLANAKVTITLDFSKGDLEYPNGFQLTDQYMDQGILFVGGAQENIVVSGMVYNPHVAFLQTVSEVTVVIVDQNDHPQTHSLVAYDTDGVLIDKHLHHAQYTESGEGSIFTLRLKYSDGISEIFTTAEPPGAQLVRSISYTLK